LNQPLQEKNIMPKMLMLLFAGLAISLVNVASAQDRAAHNPEFSKPGQATEAPTTLKKEVLKASYFDSSAADVFAYCVSAGCFATTNIYTENLTCPGSVGKTCTYEVVIDSQVLSSGFSKPTGEEGLYQFLIDGAVPNGGGTLGSYYLWQNGGPSFLFTASHSVHGQVTNSAANQAHSVVVNVECSEILSDPAGCYAESNNASLTVRVLTP
jgi:hypothetical protein